MAGGGIILLLIGPTGSGKTSFAKFAGCDVEVTSRTTACKGYPTKDQRFWIIDTPGLDDVPANNLAILKNLAHVLNEIGPDQAIGAIFFHRITDGKFGGTARSHLDIFKQICGPDFKKQAAFVTSMWNRAGAKGRVTYERSSHELATRYFLIGPTFTFESDTKSVQKVLEHFSKTPPKTEPQLVTELKRVGSSLSGVRKTSAGKAVLAARKRGGGGCVIL
ncbi:hypothetical protein OQA88_12744 [Cercophora sp. LCS_1]